VGKFVGKNFVEVGVFPVRGVRGKSALALPDAHAIAYPSIKFHRQIHWA
jgi:hypothetical protein